MSSDIKTEQIGEKRYASASVNHDVDVSTANANKSNDDELRQSTDQ